MNHTLLQQITKKDAKAFTHSGKFHADDVFSSALLLYLNPKITITRGSKVPEGYDGIVFDIGRGEYDHHQKDSRIRENGVPYAAFGLLWERLGAGILGEELAQTFDEAFVQPLDNNDNTGEKNELATLIGNFNPTGIAVSSSHVQNAIAGSYHWVITLSRAIVNEQTGEREGVFFVDLNYSAISSLCSNTSIGSKGYIFILDEKGSMIYHPQQQLIYGGLKEERIEDILASKGDFLETEEGEDSKLYTMSKSEKTGWTVVGASYVTELMKNNRQAQMLYLLAAAGILIGVILISSFISSEITKPLRRLRDSMSLVEKGDFEQASVEITAENEIGSLSKSFNAMTQKIHALMEQNIYEQKQKRKSEMKALQAQINPHFLYNTLDSIIWMSEAGENDQVVLMTSALAKLLRQSISNDREQITVAEEIDYVRSYLTIQKMRYKDKLEYTIDVEERILDVWIIKFVLQPLVENAIYHGLKYKETKGNLDIRGYRRGNRVCLVVADDGAGMEESELEHILEKKEKKTKSNGVGVYNVQKRLQLYYGAEYGISYISRKGEGTVATVTIPLDGGKSNEETGR